MLDNLKQLSPQQIFGELANSQVFPRLYLFFVQAVSRFFDYNIISLRMLPFMCMILSFFLWMKIYRDEKGINWGYFLFALSWCGSYFMTYYSAEIKQYSGDLLVTAVFTIFVLKQRRSVQPQELY